MFITTVSLICIIIHSVISFDCEDIFFGIQDFHLCPKNCLVCSIHNSCIFCLRNSLGSSCRAKCTSGCTEVYVTNGTILRDCYSEKLGNTCCMTCPHYSFCSDCRQFNGTCLKCFSGFYRSQTSSYCDTQCGHCQPDDNGIVECDIYTGDCKDECSDGYYGRRCDENCSDNCFEFKTNRTICDRLSGNCIYGCVPGRYDTICKSICSYTCLESSCDQHSGTCTFGCIGGWYGKMCEKNCSETCARLSCNQTTGHCIHGCVSGRYGHSCEHVCSNNCKNSVCMQTTGNCCNGCSAGWYGDKCDIKCNEKCFEKVCNSQSGHCYNGCSAGWFGTTCEKPCSSYCSGKICNQSSGFCQNGCAPGSYGDLCEMKCNGTCRNETCDQISSDCIYGCVSGWHGDSCGESCSNACFNRSCDQFSGVCDKGCNTGYYGSKCEENCSYDDLLKLCTNSTFSKCSQQCTSIVVQGTRSKISVQTTKQFTTLTVVFYSLVGIISSIIFALAMYFIRRVILSRRQSLRNSLEIPTIETTEPLYEEIDDMYDSTTFVNDPILVSRTSPKRDIGEFVFDKTSMIDAKSACGISHSYDLNRKGILSPSRGSYEIPVSSATMMYINIGAAGIDERQHINHKDISGGQSIQSSSTSENKETEKDHAYDGVKEHQGDEKYKNENTDTFFIKENELYLHPMI